MADDSTIRVKPAPGCKVRWPGTGKPLDADGEAVPANDPYWIRKLADLDVIAAPKTPAKKEG